MRGAWTSGGIEFNYGIIGHTPNCSTPVDYVTRVNADGCVSCIIGTLDLVTRTNWRVEINLPVDKAYFTTRSFWHNATAVPAPYYHWSNAAVSSEGNLEFVAPGNKYIGHAGETGAWPMHTTNGKNLGFLQSKRIPVRSIPGGFSYQYLFPNLACDAGFLPVCSTLLKVYKYYPLPG